MSNERARLLKILNALQGDAIALSAPEGFAMTGAQLAAQIEGLWTALKVAPRGARIATLLPDAPMTAVSLLAMVHHVQVMPINPALSDVEINAILSDGKAQMLLGAQGDPRAAKLAGTLPLATLDPGGALALPHLDGREGEPGLILLTSGSTGTPKRVPLTPAQLHLSAGRIARALKLGADDRAVHALPMFHIGAIVDLLLAPLCARGSVHFAGGMGADPLCRAVLDHGGTWLQLVPTMLARLQADLSTEQAAKMGARLRFIRSVSSDLAPHAQAKAEAFFADTPLIQMYGMTETAGQITTNPLPPERRKPGSVGRTFEVDLRIKDAEIQVRGASVTAGYEGNVTSDHITPDGWLRTGDLGRIDAEGFLFLTGRAKEIINRGGEKISPHEIEHAALSCDGVIEAAAFARPHPSLGEEVGLAVTFDAAGNLEALRKVLDAALAPFKQPRKILVLDPLPRLGSGKIDRRALVELEPESVEQVYENVEDNVVTKHVVAAWRAVLPSTEGRPLASNLDFFDAGGDSLAAAQFLFEVERLTGRALPVNLLYEAPEFGPFVQAVQDAPLRAFADASDPKHAFLQSRLATWKAHEVAGVPLMRALHVDTPGNPLFWCAQEENEYQQLSCAFEGKRPLYLMRSLFLMLGKNDEMSNALAAEYATAIAVLQPSGAIRLGGFCEGAKVMRFAARHLIEMGREVQIIIAWDQWFDVPLAVPTLHLWSDERYTLYQRKTPFPERAIAPAHPTGYEVLRVGGAHTQVITHGPLDAIIPKIEMALDAGICAEPHVFPAIFDRPVSGKIKTSTSLFFKRGQQVMARVLLTNTGAEAWQATQAAPLFVTAQVRNLDGHIANPLAGFAEITAPVAPGETRAIKMQIDAPSAFQPIKLYIDLVDNASNSSSFNGLSSRGKFMFPILF